MRSAENTRLYMVSQDTGDKFLVDAATPAQALRHVTAGMFDITVATPKQVAQLVADGVEVERAKAGEEANAAVVRG